MAEEKKKGILSNLFGKKKEAYVYIAYASDANGTGFTTTFDASLDYIAIKATTSPIASPQASDFTGLWKNYKGEKGDTGATGSAEEEAARKAAEEAAQLAKSREEAAKVMEKAKAEAQAREAELKAKAEAEEEARKAEVKKQLEERAKAAEEARKKAAETAASAQAKAEAAAEAAKPKFIAEHTVGPDDTLSHIALKFYGSAGRSFWMHIYEANKAVIGDNPGIIRPGTVLQIPELTPELKELLK